MALQVSYPGVYIEEFAPGAPIQGVGTSTAAFIGVARSGPIKKATLVQSWDDFKRIFGGFIDEPPTGYLAPAVYGFFLNGGTACYIVRAGSGKMAEANLDSRQQANPKPALIARAIQEGPEGNSISVKVSDSSRLSSMLKKISPLRNITEVLANLKTITIGNNKGYAHSEAIVLKKVGNADFKTIVAKTVGNNQLELVTPIQHGVDFTNGTVEPAGNLTLWRVEANIQAVSNDRTTLTVDDNNGFAQDDRILIKDNADANPITAIVKSKQGADTIVLAVPIPGNVDYTNGKVRISDTVQGQKVIRLAVPPDLQLSQALPMGTNVLIKQDAKSEFCVVSSSGGDTITLKDGLNETYDLSSSANLPSIESLEFDLFINDIGKNESETFQYLAMNSDHPNYWANNITSKLITIEEPTELPVVKDPRPKANTYNLTQGTADNRALALNNIKNNPNDYLDVLKPYDDVSLVCIPGITEKAVQQAIITHCEAMRDRFGILDSIKGSEPGDGIRDQFGDVRSKYGFAALYYPWILVRNPNTGKDELCPPSGHIAGIYARTDTQRGVHKAPANTNIRGALGLERRLTDEEQGPLNLMGINVLRVFPGQSQPQVWGARTTAEDRNWQYVNIRRLFLFMEESIEEGIRWAVFEPNNLQLWQKLRRSITEFLTRVWRDGALFGASAEQAFYVRIDEALNPPSTQALGHLYIEIGVRPTYPAEFIIVRIGIWHGGSEVTEG